MRDSRDSVWRAVTAWTRRHWNAGSVLVVGGVFLVGAALLRVRRRETAVTAVPPQPTRPGLGSAYEFLRPAYDIALRRADVAEARARANVTFAGTLMFAAPAVITAAYGAAALGSGVRSFASPWFIVGAGAFVLVIVCLVIQQIPKFVGVLEVVSLEVITSDAYLNADDETAKLNLLLHGVQAQTENNKYVDKMALCAMVGAVLFGVQVGALAVWVLHG